MQRLGRYYGTELLLTLRNRWTWRREMCTGGSKPSLTAGWNLGFVVTDRRFGDCRLTASRPPHRPHWLWSRLPWKRLGCCCCWQQPVMRYSCAWWMMVELTDLAKRLGMFVASPPDARSTCFFSHLAAFLFTACHSLGLLYDSRI